MNDLHSVGNRQQHRPPLRISQVLSACAFCKGRKIKCDGVPPACGGCTKFGRASTCSLSTGFSQRGRDYRTYLQNRIHKLRNQLQYLKDDHARAWSSDPERSEILGNDVLPSLASAADAGRNRSCVIDNLIADIGALPILASFSPSSNDSLTLSTVVLGAAGTVPLSSLQYGTDDLFLPKRSTALKLAQHYIEDVYPRLPFFSIQGFWTQFNYVFSSDAHSVSTGQNQSPPSDPTTVLSPSRLDLNTSELNQGYGYFTVLLVLAISTSSLSRNVDSIISGQAQRLFLAALKFRESAILPNTIVGVQSLLFLIQYATLNPSVLDAWYLIGVAMRNCIDLGLHQDPTPLDSVSAGLLETRRRLWWSVYSFDRSISLGYGRPTEISDSVISVQLPSFCIESVHTEVQIEGYLQRYRALELQSLIYHELNSRPNMDPNGIVNRLTTKLITWREGNSPQHSQTLVASEWYMSEMLLFRPCRLLPQRTLAEVVKLWSAARGFVSLYRQLVESNGIFYIQIASEKVYWAGLGILHSFWKVCSIEYGDDVIYGENIRPVDLWMAVKDVLFIIRTLSERWKNGSVLAEEFEKISSRIIELAEAGRGWTNAFASLPVEVVDFGDYSSLTSVWTSGGSEHGNGGTARGNDTEELHDLISEMANA